MPDSGNALHTTIGNDSDLFAGGQKAPGQVGAAVTTTHELEHDVEGLTKGTSSLQAGSTAMENGDAPDASGKKNTLGGTAQKGAEEIMAQDPDMTDEDASKAVESILKSGQKQWQESPAKKDLCTQNKDSCH